MISFIKEFFEKQDAQGMAEYALILALVALVVITALTALGGAIGESFEKLVDKLPG